MHTVFTIPHIQKRIFGEVDELITDSDLLSIALTCTQFKEIALDVLWVHMGPGDLTPLIKTTSEGDLWAIEGEDLIFLRELTEADWAKLLYYGRRIRLMSVWSSLGIGETALQALCSYRPSEPIMPRIQRLHINLNEPRTFHLFHYFPRIMRGDFNYHVELSIDNTSLGVDSQKLKTFLYGWPGFDKTLRELQGGLDVYLGDHETMYSDSPIWEEVILKLNKLESLTYTGVHITPRLIVHLSQLPAFTEWWHVDLRQNASANLSTLEGGHISFRQLEKLVFMMEPCPASLLLSLLKTIESPLEVLYLVPSVPRLELDEVERLCSVIGGFPALRTLRMYLDGGWTFRSLGSISPALDSLTTLQQLRDVDLHLPFTRFLKGSDLEKMAVAWSHLQRLKLQDTTTSGVYLPVQADAKLEDLLHFARHCRKLESLDISVNCQPFPMEKVADAGNTSLQKLRLLESPLEVEHVPGVLQCIQAMFPLVRDVNGSGGSGSRGWDHVREQRNTFFKVSEDGVY